MRILRMEWFGLLGFLFLCAPSFAATGDNSVGLKVGQVWPSGEIGQNVDSAIAPGIFYEHAASDVFSAYADFTHSNHSDGLLKMNSATVGIKANLFYFDRLTPYALVGAGLYFVDQAIGAEMVSKTNFGLEVGLGADLDISDRFFLGLEFDIHNLFTSTAILASGERHEISGRWAGFFLRGGVRF